MNNIVRQAGLSLVEVLVALVISLFLLGGIVQVYMGNKSSFAFTNALAEVQENGRYALDAMSQDLRLAGTWGCIAFDPAEPDNVNNTLGAGNVAGYDTNWHDFVNEEAIQGTNGTGLNGSDTLIIRGGKPGQANVQAPFSNAATQWITADSVSTLAAGDIILVARCGANDLSIAEESDILPITAVDAGTGQITLGAAKSQQYGNDATIIELQSVGYSIRNGANGEPALFRAEFGNPQELVEGVQDMQVLFGIDTDSDQFPNQYVTSNNVGPDFEDVVSIRLMLLVRSIDDFVTDDPQTYTFNGATVTPADRRIRQVFTSTIALRNRIGS